MVFGERRRFESREMRERLRSLCEKRTRLNLEYRNRYLDTSRRYRGGVEN